MFEAEKPGDESIQKYMDRLILFGLATTALAIILLLALGAG